MYYHTSNCPANRACHDRGERDLFIGRMSDKFIQVLPKRFIET